MNLTITYEDGTPIDRPTPQHFAAATAIARACYEYEAALGTIGHFPEFQVRDDGAILYSAAGNQLAMCIATHDAVFHADDVFGGALMRLAQPHASIIRTRDADLLAAAQVCFDVGGGAYDHHQRGGNGVRANGIPYAAFGLLWREFGTFLCDGDAALAAEVDRLLVQAIDAHDNGYPLVREYALNGVFPATIAHAVSSFNPSWDEGQDFDAAYWRAVDWAMPILTRAIARARGKLLAAADIADAIHAAKLSADDERIILLHRFVPWQEELIAQSADALYIVYPSAGTWRVQVVPVEAGKPSVRRPLPAAWGGLDGPALVALTGVADATFAHPGLFIAGARSEAGALALARLALAGDERWSYLSEL